MIAVVISGAAALSLLCVVAWMVLGGDADEREPEGVQIIAPSESSESDAIGSPSATALVEVQSEAKPPEQITVYITGEVADPGVYTVAKGERLDVVLLSQVGPLKTLT